MTLGIIIGGGASVSVSEMQKEYTDFSFSYMAKAECLSDYVSQ